jgi:hypothetical protein
MLPEPPDLDRDQGDRGQDGEIDRRPQPAREPDALDHVQPAEGERDGAEDEEVVR